MSESTLERPGFPENKHQQEQAHGWVATLAQRMVAFGGEGVRHVESVLETDQQNVVDLLCEMRVDDLLLAPGDMAGELLYAEFYNNGVFHDKMGLSHAGSFIIPPAPTRIFMSALDHPAQGEGLGMQCLGIGLEYKRGNSLYKQVIGLVAQPDCTVEAVRLVQGASGERTVLEGEYTRPHGFVETRQFVACMEDLFAFTRNIRNA